MLDAEVHEDAAVKRDLMCDWGVAGRLVGDAGGPIVAFVERFSCPSTTSVSESGQEFTLYKYADGCV